MALPTFSMRQLLEAGIHFGHQTHRWNPKMEPFIFGVRNGVHILDLAQTVPLLHQALVAVRDTIAGGGRLLFVGTKRAASVPIAEAARSSAQYYMNHRWLGGTLTNWHTISNSIKRLKKLHEILSQDNQPFTKKELLGLTRERDKLEQALGGIQDMSGLPDLMFVIDTNKEAIAIQEARKLGIPIVAVLDSNCNPDGIDYPVPGNDDAGRAVALYCDLMARAAIEGISASQLQTGIDIGAAEEPVAEVAVAHTTEAPPVNVPTNEGSDAPEEHAKHVGHAEPVESMAGVEVAHVKRVTKAKVAPAKPAKPTKPAKSAKEASPVDAPAYKGLDAPDGEADDLKKLAGVGPALEGKLNGLGIFHYRQIAGLTAKDFKNIDAVLKFGNRIEHDSWRAQAAELAKG